MKMVPAPGVPGWNWTHVKATGKGWKRRLEVDLERPAPAVIEAASRAVEEGEVILYPTDTIYGFGCHGFCTSAVERIIRLKRRAPDKGLLLLIPHLRWADKLVTRLPREFHRVAGRLWPGPVTFLIPAAPSLPAPITGTQGKVGLRYPSLPFLRLWLERLDAPIVSTSANLAGQPAPESGVELEALFGRNVDLFLDAGTLPESAPSTVLDLCGEAPRIVRQGAMDEQILQLLAGELDSR